MDDNEKLKEIHETYSLCAPYIKAHRIALDIGCDQFMFAGVLSEYFDAVHCWDFRDKSKSMKRHVRDTSKIFFHNTGLGEKHDIKYTKPGVGRIKSDYRNGSSTLQVPVETLDSFKLLEKVDFIKLDIEGFEPAVIRGGLKTITHNWPVILCEINKGDFTAKDILEDIGYHVVEVYHNKEGLVRDYLFVRE